MSQTARQTDTSTLPRTMGLFALTVYGVGDMLGAGIYTLMGPAAGAMGNTVWLGFIAAMLAAMLTGLSYASLGSRYPKAAGAAYITQRAYGIRMLAYTLGLMVMASGLCSLAAGANAFAEVLHRELFGPGETVGWLGRVKFWPIILTYIGALTFINFWGMRESTWMNAVCTFVEVGGLLVVIAVGMKYWGSVNYLETPVDPATGSRMPLSLPLIMSGGVLTFYAFVGFEDMLNVTEEVKDVERVFPRAMLLAVGITTLIYLAVAITAVSVLPHEEFAKGASLVTVVAKAAPGFPTWIFAGVSLFAIANTGLLNYIMGSRIVYGMARQGMLPTFLGRLHANRRTPHLAILVGMVLVTGLALSGGIAYLAQATSLLLLVVFGTVNIALIVLKQRPGEPQGRFNVPSIVPALGALVCLGLVVQKLYEGVTKPWMAGHTPPWLPQALSVGIVLVIVALYFVMRPKVVAARE